MATPAVSVDGAARLRRSLKAAGVGVQDLKDAHAAAAALVRDAAVADPAAPRRSGDLIRSLRSSGTQSAAIVRAGSKAVPYAGPIHWGWPARGITAQPWIADAAERRAPDWTDTYLAALEAVIATVEGTTTP